MRRHTPTLYSHPEQDTTEAGSDPEWAVQGPLPSRPHHFSTPTIPTSISPRNRLKTRPQPSFSPAQASLAANTPPLHSAFRVSKYSDIYSQFVRRYRSEPGLEENFRDDPDSHYFQKNLGQLVDTGDSDDEDLGRVSLAPGGDTVDRFSALMLESEPAQAATLEERERLEWQTMLASVLDGDVLKSEKTRIAVALDTSADEQNNLHLNIWLGIRAKCHGRSEEEERKRLEERRLRTVDAVIEEIMTFRVEDSPAGDHTTVALKHVNAVLRRLDVAQSLYPTLKAFYQDKSAAAEGQFQARCDTLNTWSKVLTSLRRQLALLRKWTGSERLDVTQPNTTAEIPICSQTGRAVKHGPTEIADGTTFVERVLKEDSIQQTFEKGFLVTVHAFIGAARDAQVNLSSLFKEMNLPTLDKELVPLISFPTKLVQASLRVRLDYVQKLKDPEVLIIDQMTEDLKLSIGLACTLKRQYGVFMDPDPDGKWTLPQCISDDYDSTILEALSIFFTLIHWKLKSGVKGIYFKETELLEAQWATFNDVSLTAAEGSSLVAEQLW
jgi:mitogen-activated protein kinase kinase kinase